MKNLKLLLILATSALMLSACGDDSGSSSHADIKKAKELAKEFDQSAIIRRGYIRPQNTHQVNQTLNQYARNGAHSFYQMHAIGCIASDGSKTLITDELLVTSSLILGEVNNKATYLQLNEPGNCYIAGGQVSGGGFGWDFFNKSWNWGKIPNCQTLQTTDIYRRLDKEQVKQYAYGPYGNSYSQSSINPHEPSWHGGNYWDWERPNYNNHHYNLEHEDSYFKVFRMNFGQEQLRYFSPAVNDRFAKVSNGRAVFVTETVGPQKSSSCHKVVYYGHSMDINQPVIAEFFKIQPYNVNN